MIFSKIDNIQLGEVELTRPTCAVCQKACTSNHDAMTGVYLFTCPQCGTYKIHDHVADDLRALLKRHEQVSLLSHKVRHSQKQNDPPIWDYAACERVLNVDRLPSPIEQIDYALRWVGDASNYAGSWVGYNVDDLLGFIGATREETVMFCVSSLRETGLLQADINPAGVYLRLKLTATGWDHYNKLVNQAENSQTAFMAMKFGDADLDIFVNNFLRPGVQQTGYTIYRVDDRPQAGLIDIKMRQEIKSCKFMIADLTHANLGAYWEAGFAEGVGKQVIYTCEDSVFKEVKTHFDVNHHLTITWKKDDMPAAIEQLKAAIRYTFPEAKQTD